MATSHATHIKRDPHSDRSLVYEVYYTLRSHFKTIFQLKQIKLESGETPTQRPRQHCLSETDPEMEYAYIKITRVKNNWKRFQLDNMWGRYNDFVFLYCIELFKLLDI